MPLKLNAKLEDLEVPTLTCNWILDLLTDRPHMMSMEKKVSAEFTGCTRTLQGCFLSPKLCTLYTHDLPSTHDNNVVIKYIYSMYKYILSIQILGVIRWGDESSHRDLFHKITIYGDDNGLIPNREKKSKNWLWIMIMKVPPLQPSRGLWWSWRAFTCVSLNCAKISITTVKELNYIRMLKKKRLKCQPR